MAFSLLPFDDLVVAKTEQWRNDTSNFELDLLELVNSYIVEKFGESVQQYNLETLTAAVNLMELKEQSKNLGPRLNDDIIKKLVYRLVRFLIQSQKIQILNKQKFNFGLLKLGLLEYELEGHDSKNDLDKTVLLLSFAGP
jgi:hypothetical protein